MVCVNKEQGDSHAARAQTRVTNSFIWYVSNRCRRRRSRFIPLGEGTKSLCTAHMHALFYYCRRTHWCSRHDDLSIYKLFNKLKKRALPVTMTLSMGNKALVSQAVVCSEINMLTPRPKGKGRVSVLVTCGSYLLTLPIQIEAPFFCFENDKVKITLVCFRKSAKLCLGALRLEKMGILFILLLVL